jgi:hypothetical protein
MKNPRFISSLGFITGGLFMFFGVALLVGGPLLTGEFNSVLSDSSSGLRTASCAIKRVTTGVNKSVGMVEEVRLSLVNTSEVVTGTASVVEQTVGILEHMGIILPSIAGDMASMPVMVRNMVPNNHFDEVAERTQTVAVELDSLNARLEILSGGIERAGAGISLVAASVEALEDDLLSSEGSFSDAAAKIDETADAIDSGSFISGFLFSVAGLGLLMFLLGFYQISSGMIIRRLLEERASE